MIYTYKDIIRGDDSYIPIMAVIPDNATTTIHLRESANSSSYYILSVVNNSVYIPSTISVNLQGHYEFDIECTIAGEVLTIQHTDLDVIPDVSRTYGDVQQINNEDFERKKIVAGEYWIKDDQNNLISLKPIRYQQNQPSAIWVIAHGLNKYPSVMVSDSAGTIVEGRIEYIDSNNLEIHFNAEFSGYANLN